MRVALELQPCCGNRSGVGIYTYELAKRLNDAGGLTFGGNLFNFLGRNDNHEALKGISFPIHEARLLPYGVYRRIWDIFPIPYPRLFPSADITHFFNYIVPPRVSGKVITTIHDMTYLRFPETMDAKNLARIRRGIDRSIERSARIITVSEFSKQEIMELLGLPPDRVSVVPNAASVSGEFLPLEFIREKFHLTHTPYLLYVGTIEPRKNLARLIQAFDRLKADTGLPHKLVLAGGKGWNTGEIFKAAREAAFSDEILFTGYLDTAEKNTLYRHADLFVFPSVYEGFGIPVLEAMAFGIPVVCADAASLPEVAGGCAELVNPYQPDQIAAGMARVLLDESRRRDLAQSGPGQAANFTWESAADKLIAIYRSLGD